MKQSVSRDVTALKITYNELSIYRTAYRQFLQDIGYWFESANQRNI